MLINWVRLGLGILLVVFWVNPIVEGYGLDDAQKIVWTLLFCFSFLLIGLAFERRSK
jgi:hypothetical protein